MGLQTNPIPRVFLDRASAHVAFKQGVADRKGTVIAGQVALQAGNAIVPIPGLTADMAATATIRTPGGTIGAQYVCSFNASPTGLNIQSIDTASAPNAADTSTMQYIVVVG